MFDFGIGAELGEELLDVGVLRLCFEVEGEAKFEFHAGDGAGFEFCEVDADCREFGEDCAE